MSAFQERNDGGHWVDWLVRGVGVVRKWVTEQGGGGSEHEETLYERNRVMDPTVNFTMESMRRNSIDSPTDTEADRKRKLEIRRFINDRE